MAEKKPEAASDEPATKNKGKNKLILFIVIGVVVALVVVGGGTAFYVMKKNAAAEAAADEDGEEAPAKDDKHAKKEKGKKDAHALPPAFYKFDKPFTVKLQGGEGGQDAYLQAEVQLKITDPHGADTLKAYDPELKHKLTLTLMTKKVTDVNNAIGVQRLSYEMRDVVNDVLDPPGPKHSKAAAAEPQEHAAADAPVQAVLFTTFIVQ